MTAEAELLVGVWDAVQSHIPARERADVAEAVVRCFSEMFDEKELAPVIDENDVLATAYATVFDIEPDDDETDDEA